MKLSPCILFALFFFTNQVYGQIVLEHIYPKTDPYSKNIQATLTQVDTNEWKFLLFDGQRTVSIYSLNHTLEKTILLPGRSFSIHSTICFLTKKLFNQDDKYELLFTFTSGSKDVVDHIQIYNEDTVSLFNCDSCYLSVGTDGNNLPTSAITNTSQGAKMLINRKDTILVYSLPGRLPAHSSIAHGTNDGGAYTFPTSAFPNPSTGSVKIEYTLPAGATNGQLILNSSDGKQVGSYPVGSFFNDITIATDNLASGTYYYKIVTTQGASETRSLVITK